MMKFQRCMVAVVAFAGMTAGARAQDDKPVPLPIIVPKAVELDAKALASELKVTFASAIATALKAKPGTAVATEVEGTATDGKREVYLEVMVYGTDGKFWEVKLDPATGVFRSAAEESEEEELKDLREVVKKLPATKVTLADAIAKAESYTKGTVISASFGGKKSPTATVVFANGSETVNAVIDASTGKLKQIALPKVVEAKAAGAEKGEKADKPSDEKKEGQR